MRVARDLTEGVRDFREREVVRGHDADRAALDQRVNQSIGADAPEITARFRDPGGNVIGLYQQPQ